MPELFNIRLDDDDRALLDACAAKDKLTRSDVMRRALRAYAKTLGVKPETKKRERSKKK